MEYHIKKINAKEEIASCELFEVSHFQWVDGPKPKTWGYMGYLKGKGLYVQMNCQEADPRRESSLQEGKEGKIRGKRVCDDSAMEIFLGFPEKDGTIGGDSLYVNFEINANGVLFANYGRGRQNRKQLPDSVYGEAKPYVSVSEDSWTLEVLFPENFLKEISGMNFNSGDEFYCNFYKISETPEIEHYGTFAEIRNETPNFHMPVFFAKAIML